MTLYSFTLKFDNGATLSGTFRGTPAEYQAHMRAKMARTGAYGYRTTSRVTGGR